MSSIVAAPAAPNGDNGNHQGHCSRCGKVWTLKERQGVCQWCGKPASCQTTKSKPGHIKSRSIGRRKQHNTNGNGYDRLSGSWLTYYVCRAEKCKMKFIRVSQLDKNAWETIIKMLQDSDLVERQLNGDVKENDGIIKRIKLELFHKREAERKISDIQDDYFASPPLITREEAADKIKGLRASVAKAEAEIARLQGIAQASKQSQETVAAAKKALEALRDLNLKTANFQEQSELVARMGVKIYPDEDITYMRIYSVLNIEEPRKVSCQIISIASPKL